MRIYFIFKFASIPIFRSFLVIVNFFRFTIIRAVITMQERIKKVKEFLIKELNSPKYKKNELAQMHNNIFKVSTIGKKQRFAESVCSYIAKEITSNLRQLDRLNHSKEEYQSESKKIVQSKLALYKIQDYKQGISNKINDILNSENPEQITTMSRQVKPNQEIIRDIWDQQTQSFIDCICPKVPTNLQETKRVEKCYNCGQMCHVDCFWPREKQDIYECPFCFIRNCNPQKQVKKIIFAGYLPILKKQKIEYRISFSLDPSFKAEKSQYLQARCIKFNSKNRYQISWPDNGAFYLGKIKLQDFRPLQNNSPLKRRPDEPIKMDKNRLQMENQVTIEERTTSEVNYRVNKKSCHLIVIMMVQDLPKQQVLTKLQRNFLTVNQSKNLIKQYLDHESQDLMIEKLSVSLKCQFYYNRIKIPVRSKLCSTHYQPFDLANFINSSIFAKNSTKKWKCPICDKRAYDVVVDKYILQLMQKDKKADIITFKNDAEPEMHQEQIESSESQDNEKILTHEDNCINLDSTPIEAVSEPRQLNPPPNFISADPNKDSYKSPFNICYEQNAKSLKRYLQNSDEQLQGYRKTNKYQKLSIGSDKNIGQNNIKYKGKNKKISQQNVIDIVQISSEEEISQLLPSIPFEEEKKKVMREQKSNGRGKYSRKNQFSLKRKYYKQKQYQDFTEIQQKIQEYNRLKQNQQRLIGSKRMGNQQSSNGLVVIEIDSEEDIGNGSGKKDDLDKEYEQLKNLKNGLLRLGKPTISEEDTQIFDSLYKKIMTKDSSS